MRVLYTYTESFATNLVTWLVCGGLLVFFLLLIASAILGEDKHRVASKVCSTISVIAFLVFLTSAVLGVVTDDSPFAYTVTRHACILDDDIDANEILSKYKIITTRGDIVVLEEKEQE